MKIEIPESCIAPEAYAESYAEGVRLERARTITILTSDAAQTRPELAKKMAFDTDMSAEAAAAFMASLPAEELVSSIPPMDERADSAGESFGTELPGGLEAYRSEVQAKGKPQGALGKTIGRVA